jgi:hypothetical protein
MRATSTTSSSMCHPCSSRETAETPSTGWPVRLSRRLLAQRAAEDGPRTGEVRWSDMGPVCARSRQSAFGDGPSGGRAQPAARRAGLLEAVVAPAPERRAQAALSASTPPPGRAAGRRGPGSSGIPGPRARCRCHMASAGWLAYRSAWRWKTGEERQWCWRAPKATVWSSTSTRSVSGARAPVRRAEQRWRWRGWRQPGARPVGPPPCPASPSRRCPNPGSGRPRPCACSSGTAAAL